MANEQIFKDIHLPGGLRLATNPSNTDEENRELDSLFSEQDVLSKRGEDSSEGYERLASLIEDRERAGNDNERQRRNTKPMNDITREELNAKLEIIEVKMDARVETVSAKIDAFLSAQVERDKAQLERDKRYELLSERITKAAEGAKEAAKQAATVKSNYWAAVGLQLFAVAAILVGAYFATQANTLSAITTTLSAFQAGKTEASSPPPLQQAPSK